MVFIRDEVPLEVSFELARDRLARPDCWFLDASSDAYAEGMTSLVRIGPLGTAVSMSRLVEVRFHNLTARDDRAGIALRWETHGFGAKLFPVLDADLLLSPLTESAALLTLSGTYRHPLGSLGAGLDRVILHRVAKATIANFLKRVAEAITCPAVFAPRA